MSIAKPFHRNRRALIERSNSGYSSVGYIEDREYASNPEHYTRAFLLIQNDLKKLFEYVEPSFTNLNTYSYRIHELFMRTCIEIEANFKAIFQDNIYKPLDRNNNVRNNSKWNMSDYKLINQTHHLSSYSVEVPVWDGENNIYKPFEAWNGDNGLPWYQAYNKSKHDRQNNFKLANLKNLMDSITALFILLSSQFGTNDFSPGSDVYISSGGGFYSGTFGIGDFFIINFPDDWDEDDIYDFDWAELRNETDRFHQINYNNL